MKTLFEKRLEFITPAFLCGADQSKAELRPASIRGQLRWWFRVLGGSREMESALFGGVHGGTTASKIVVRAGQLDERHVSFSKPAPFTGKSYLFYFATVSGARKGIRIEKDAYFAPGTRFTLSVLERFPLDEAERGLLTKTLDAFVRLGALGLRATRGCGALAEETCPTYQAFRKWCLECGVAVHLPPAVPYDSMDALMEYFGNALKQFRKDECKSGQSESSLGYSLGNDRQASVLRLRPVKILENGQIRFIPAVFHVPSTCKHPDPSPIDVSRFPVC